MIKIKKEWYIVSLIFILLLSGCQPTKSAASLPKPYNLTGIYNSTDVYDFIKNTNDGLLEGMFGTGIILAIFIICMFSFTLTMPLNGAVAASCYISLVLGILMLGMALISNITFYIILIGTAVSTAFLFKRN